MAQVLFGGGRKLIVQCKSPHKVNHWAKIRVATSLVEGGGGQDEAGRGELVDLWGPVGEYANELKAYQWHFGIMPCKYPAAEEWGLSPVGGASPEGGGGGGGGAGAPSLGEVLDGAGLSQYTDKFLAEDIDLDAFGQVQRKGVLLAAFLAAWGVN